MTTIYVQKTHLTMTLYTMMYVKSLLKLYENNDRSDFFMLLSNVLKEFLFEIKIRNYTTKPQKGYKNNNDLFHN